MLSNLAKHYFSFNHIRLRMYPNDTQNHTHWCCEWRSPVRPFSINRFEYAWVCPNLSEYWFSLWAHMLGLLGKLNGQSCGLGAPHTRRPLLTLNDEGAQLGGQFEGDGQSALQDVLFDLQKQLVPVAMPNVYLSIIIATLVIGGCPPSPHLVISSISLVGSTA